MTHFTLPLSGAHGKYEFQPLPAGDYEIDVKSIGTFHPAGSFIDLKDGQCCCRSSILPKRRLQGTSEWTTIRQWRKQLSFLWRKQLSFLSIPTTLDLT